MDANYRGVAEVRGLFTVTSLADCRAQQVVLVLDLNAAFLNRGG